MGLQSSGPLGIPRGIQEILNAVYDHVRRVFTAELLPVTLAASANINAAGSAQLLAASATNVYAISHYDITALASASFGLKIGGRKITPMNVIGAKGTQIRTFTRLFKGAASEAVKISASAGSARAIVHYIKTTS